MSSKNFESGSGTLVGSAVAMPCVANGEGFVCYNDDASNTYDLVIKGETIKVKAGEKIALPLSHDSATLNGTGAYRWQSLENAGDLPNTVWAASTGTAGVSDSSITSAKILDATIVAADLATDSVEAAEIAAGAVGTSEVAADSLGAADLAPDSVEASEIAAGAVGTSEIATDGVGADEIATSAVGTAEVNDNTLTADDLAPSSVGASEMADGTQTPAELANVANGATMGSCPIVYRKLTTAGAGDNDIVVDRKVRVIQTWAVLKAAGGGAATVQFKNGATAITDAKNISALGDTAIAAFTQIDDAQHEIAAAGTLRITTTDAACPALEAYAMCLPVA